MSEEKKPLHIEHQGGGIVCDNPKCDYEDTTVTDDNYHEYVNKPCPKCGENLLTEEDYQTAKNLIAVIDAINSMDEEAMGKLYESLSGKPASELPLLTEDTVKKLELSVKVHNGIHVKDVKISDASSSEE